MPYYKYEQPSWSITFKCFSFCPQNWFSTSWVKELQAILLSAAWVQRVQYPRGTSHTLPKSDHFYIQVFSSPRSRSSPDPLHFTGRFHHCKRLPTTPVPEMYLIGSSNQQELSRRMKSKRCNGIVAICEPALTSTLEWGVKNHKQFITKFAIIKFPCTCLASQTA